VTGLNKFLDENGHLSECLVVSSIDDEGNGYNAVHYSPSIGVMVDDDISFAEGDVEYASDEPVKQVVCIN